MINKLIAALDAYTDAKVSLALEENKEYSWAKDDDVKKAKKVCEAKRGELHTAIAGLLDTSVSEGIRSHVNDEHSP